MKQHSNRLLLYFRERYNNKVGELDSLEQDETNPNGQTGKFLIHDELNDLNNYLVLFRAHTDSRCFVGLVLTHLV